MRRSFSRCEYIYFRWRLTLFKRVVGALIQRSWGTRSWTISSSIRKSRALLFAYCRWCSTPFVYQITNMCYTVAQKPLAATPAFVKIPVIAGYWFIMMFGLGYCNVAFNLLTFKRFHGVRKLLITYSANTAVSPRSAPARDVRELKHQRWRPLRKRRLRSEFALPFCRSRCRRRRRCFNFRFSP